MEHKKYNAINQPVRKKDSMQLLLGKPVTIIRNGTRVDVVYGGGRARVVPRR